MQNDFDLAVTETLDSEGVLSNDKYDAGGKTKYGITQQVATANGYPDVANMTKEQAIAIYRKQYWDQIKGDDIKQQGIALLLFDLAVNSGTGRAIKILQDSLNIQNKMGKDWPNMNVDGVLGPVTMHTLNELVPMQGLNRNLFITLLMERGELYLTICRNNESQETFIDGWENRWWKYIKYIPQN